LAGAPDVSTLFHTLAGTNTRFSPLSNVLPIFLTSAVTGKGLDLVKAMLILLPVDLDLQRAIQPMRFRVEDTLQLPDVGTRTQVRDWKETGKRLAGNRARGWLDDDG